MVDYTKPAMRDETWRRWKGGTKLAEDLRNFYTNPRVWTRLGQANPMTPIPPANTPAGDVRKQWALHGLKRTSRLRMSSRGRKMMIMKLGGSIPGEDKERSLARQSGAMLP